MTVFVLFRLFSFGQRAHCYKIAKQIEADTSKSIWDYHHLNPKVYYCLGEYFAKKDIRKGTYLIQTYGNPDWEDPCKACRYEQYGFKLQYHWDLIREERTNFIKGYNEISEAYLKSKIGTKAFFRIDVLPKSYFNPQKVINKFFDSKDRTKFYEVEEINDTSARVKIIVDSIFKVYPKLIEKIVYHVRDLKPEHANRDTFQILSYRQMKEEGFIIHKDTKGKFSYNIKFDFKHLIALNLFCSCAFKSENSYSYIDRFSLAD